jgi:mutator protein MutT
MSDREYPTRPIVGVGAIILDGDQVVLIRRAREPLKGQWSLPGGAVELGERLDAAIAREVREETGIDVDVGPVVEVLDRVRVAEDSRVQFHYVLVDFLCRPVPGTRPQDLVPGTDAEAAHWVGVESLAEYGVAEPTVRVIRKAVERARSGWAPGQGYARLD